MPVSERRGEVVGYHVYWTLSDGEQSSSVGSAAPPRPLPDKDGRAMVMPVDARIDEWSPYLPPGHYRLVPVDAEGRELADEPAMERVIDGEHLKGPR